VAPVAPLKEFTTEVETRMPREFAARTVFVSVVDTLPAKVAVAFTVRVEETVCAAVQVTELAAVTNPGFTKLIVTLPVAAVALMLVPEDIEAT
jgi:hypothetical protein